MDERSWQYLSVLDEEDPDEIKSRLQSLVKEDPHVSVVSASDESTLNLPFVGPLSVDEESSRIDRQFFHWIAKELRRRREQKYDQLTGLYTRSHWEREVKVTAQQQSWAVAMGDIDHFKQFNDDYGHDMGDRVLEAVGDLLREELPDSCQLIRYGGEEVLVLMDLEFSRASGCLDQFRQTLSESRLFADQPDNITMSFGLARHDPEESIDKTIKRADLALYESKGSGRNQLTPYAPYLDYSSRLYTWGIYRYIWQSTVRFCLAGDDLQFLLYRNGGLQWYDWRENKSVSYQIPTDCQEPIRDIRRFRDGFVLLDAGGELWHHVPGDSFDRVSTDDTPSLASLTGQGTTLRAVGVNNQLYNLSTEHTEQEIGLPETWDQIVVTDDVFVVVENILIRWADGSCVESWPLPEPPRQVTTSEESILMVGTSGRLFKFHPELNHWEQARFMNLVGSRVPCREVAPASDRMLILDDHGRLLLVYEGGDRKKSVPQVMALHEQSTDH